MRPMRPTAAGTLLYDHAQRLTRDASNLLSVVRELDSPTVPQLRIGLIDSYSIAIGPKLISSLQQQVRQLSLWSGISPGLETDLLQRNLDFIVCPNPLNELPHLENTMLYREPYVFVTSRKYTGRRSDDLFRELLDNHALIRYSKRSRIGTQIDNHLRWLGIGVREGMEFDGSEAVLSMVAEDLGWAITTPLCLLHARGVPGRSDLPRNAGTPVATNTLPDQSPGAHFRDSGNLSCKTLQGSYDSNIVHTLHLSIDGWSKKQNCLHRETPTEKRGLWIDSDIHIDVTVVDG